MVVSAGGIPAMEVIGRPHRLTMVQKILYGGCAITRGNLSTLIVEVHAALNVRR